MRAYTYPTTRVSVLVLAAVVIGLHGTAFGQASARSVAMGGALTALADGADAARYNPANLALDGYGGNSIEVLGLGVNIQNNAFTLDDYNTYSGALLTAEDKAYILGRIPDEGLRLQADVRAGVLALNLGRYALVVEGVGAVDANLSRDLFELLFNGNTFADTIDVTGSYSEAISYVSAGLSYAMPVFEHGYRQITVGGTFKYLRGIGVERITELEGFAATYATGFSGQGHATLQTASGGSGFAIDIAATMKLDRRYVVGARLENFLGRITWDKNAREYGYNFRVDTLTLDNMNGDWVVADEYSMAIPSFTTTLPPVLTVGAADIEGRFRWGVDWRQGLRRAYGVSTHPRLAAGAEYQLLRWVPVRAGYAIGGGRNAALSLGSGVDLGAFYLDYAFVTGSSLSPSSSKGLHIALSTGIRF